MNEASLQRKFDGWAEDYGSLFDPANRTGRASVFRARLALVAELAEAEQGPLLEVASGTGEITERVIAVTETREALVNDFSPNMLKTCRSRLEHCDRQGRVRWANEDVFHLLGRLAGGTYGIVLCLGLVAHVGRLEELLEGLARVTRPGGCVLFQSTLLDHPGVRITDRLARALPRRFPHRTWHYGLGELLSAANRAGFEVAETRRYGLWIPFGDRWLGLLNYLLEQRFGRSDRLGGEAILKLRKPA